MKKVCFVLVIACIFWSVQTGISTADYLSIPAAALLPKNSSDSYSTNGLFIQADGTSERIFYAPIFLPDKAYIKKITLEARDESGGDLGAYVQLQLGRYSYNTPYFLATLKTRGAGEPADGDVQVSDDVNVSVDNSTYSYGLDLQFKPGTAAILKFYKCIIEYETPQQVLSGPTN